jgi:hypothetical protein
MIVRKYTAEEVDVIAAYCAETEQVYILLPEDFTGRREVRLRVMPALNNQRLKINRAEDFTFEARLGVLQGP